MTVPQEDKLSFDVVSVPISAHGTPIPGAGRISQDRDGPQGHAEGPRSWLEADR